MREIHDYICDYPGLWTLPDAIRKAREAGFRVTTNTTIFKEIVDDARDDGLSDERGRHRRNADRTRLSVLPDRSRADDDPRGAREVRIIRKVARQRTTGGSRRRSPESHGRAQVEVRRGSITRNPYGRKAVLPADRRNLPDDDALLDGWSGRTTARQRSRCEPARSIPVSSRRRHTRLCLWRAREHYLTLTG